MLVQTGSSSPCLDLGYVWSKVFLKQQQVVPAAPVRLSVQMSRVSGRGRWREGAGAPLPLVTRHGGHGNQHLAVRQTGVMDVNPVVFNRRLLGLQT